MNIARMLKQKATKWSVTGVDGYGAPQYAAPVLVDCRWEGKTEIVTSRVGDEVRSRAKVFTATALSEDSDYLALGEHLDSLVPVADAWVVRVSRSSPDIRGTMTLFTSWL